MHSVEYMVGPRSGGVTVLPDEDEVQAKIERQVAELNAAGIAATTRIVSGSTLSGAAQSSPTWPARPTPTSSSWAPAATPRSSACSSGA